MDDGNLQQAQCLLAEADRRDLVLPGAHGNVHPSWDAAAEVAAAVLPCSPLRRNRKTHEVQNVGLGDGSHRLLTLGKDTHLEYEESLEEEEVVDDYVPMEEEHRGWQNGSCSAIGGWKMGLFLVVCRRRLPIGRSVAWRLVVVDVHDWLDGWIRRGGRS
ncbi:hypothetical protein NDU88_005366 [Pleurodeles waltl]|uniref:Uncharacterized protein n=1 Tax=Pleurodeles waltl TaxID=8319 RepID=A0AAV7RLW8_PLEWA|nr:hypothetical protein NDU88_005366 [Pleurodeles waltl]